MLSEGVGYSWGFIVVAIYGGMTETLKKKVLQELGFIVHEMWYCDYKLYHTSNDLKVVAEEEEPLRI